MRIVLSDHIWRHCRLRKWDYEEVTNKLDQNFNNKDFGLNVDFIFFTLHCVKYDSLDYICESSCDYEPSEKTIEIRVVLDWQKIEAFESEDEVLDFVIKKLESDIAKYLSPPLLKGFDTKSFSELFLKTVKTSNLFES